VRPLAREDRGDLRREEAGREDIAGRTVCKGQERSRPEKAQQRPRVRLATEVLRRRADEVGPPEERARGGWASADGRARNELPQQALPAERDDGTRRNRGPPVGSSPATGARSR